MSETPNTPGRGSPPSTPRWVIISLILFVLLVAVVVIVHLLGFRFDHGTGGLNTLVRLIENTIQPL